MPPPILAPGAVSTAISLWGDADQQAKYLPPFTEDDAPAAALAIQEPRVLFDPLELETVATRCPRASRSTGTKSLVLRAADAELFVVAARIADEGPALFIVESGTEGLSVEPEPAMGVRAAATGTLVLEDVTVARTRCSAAPTRPCTPSACSAPGSRGRRWRWAPAGPCWTT